MRTRLFTLYIIAINLFLGGIELLVDAQSTSSNTSPGQVPIPGRPVYIKQSNSLWVFSFSKNIPADNKLSFIDLNQSFNTLNPPVVDMSSLITNTQCPIMHFAQAMPSSGGVNINIFGAGSDISGTYESTMTLCQLNTQTKTWKEIKPNNAPPARRNAAFEITQSGLTFIWGGSSENITGLSSTAQGYPFYWHQDVSIYDPNNGWVNGPIYSGPPRANATMTQISDTNGQLMIIGGVTINNNSAVDMVTNLPLANMSEIIVLDPRTSSWTNIIANGPAPPSRKHHTTTLHPDGHTLIVIGGENFNASGAYVLNDVWTLDTRNMNNYTWSQPAISGDPGLFRSNHSSILIDDQLWIIAGTNASSKAVDLQLLNVTNWTWSYNAVSDYVPAASFANIGGVKGLVGIIVGVVGGVLVLSSFLIFWWCRRRRINPSSKNNLQPVLPAHGDMSYMHEQHQQMLPQQQLYHSDSYHHQDTSTVENSKIASRPSMSTTTSGGIVAAAAGAVVGNWSSPQHMNSFVTSTTSPTSHATISNSYYMPQYTSGPPPPITTTIPIADQYYNGGGHENYYAEGGYNHAGYGDADGADAIHTPGGGFGSTTTGAVYSTDTHNIQSFGFYDIPVNGGALPQQHKPQQNFSATYAQQFPDHNFMLTPMNNEGGSARPTSRLQQPQQLQKPNEVDATNLMISSPTAGSTTVYTSSTNEENNSVTPGDSNDNILNNRQ